MDCRWVVAAWPTMMLGLMLVGPGLARAHENVAVASPGAQPGPGSQPAGKPAATPRFPLVPQPPPLDDLAPELREKMRSLIDHPTLHTHGAMELFNCQPATYYWLLDNPHLTVQMWRCLGAKCTDIQRRSEGHFSWEDDQGSQVTWDAVVRTARHRVWFAEGKVKPGSLLPMTAVRAMLVVNHAACSDSAGKPAMCHQMDLYIQADNRAVALVARILGASTPHMAEQYISQIEMFFGAMAWYLDQDARRARLLLAEVAGPSAPKPAGKPAEAAGAIELDPGQLPVLPGGSPWPGFDPTVAPEAPTGAGQAVPDGGIHDRESSRSGSATLLFR